MSAPRTRPLAWILDRSPSVFASLIRRRCSNDDRPSDPAVVFRLGSTSFGKIEWPDGRWLVVEIDHRLAPTPVIGGLS